MPASNPVLYARTWRRLNPDKVKAWRKANRDRILPRRRELRREHDYGLSREAFATLLAGQDGRCAICGTDKPGGRGDWPIDHDHDTGAIRGLLCVKCNTMLGLARESIEVLAGAIAYLERAR